MNNTKTNKRDRQIIQQLKNGKAFIWDSDSDMDGLEEFLDYATNYLNKNHAYDRLIFAFDAKEDDSPPKAVAACRGDEEAFKTVIVFNECGLICVVKNKQKRLSITGD